MIGRRSFVAALVPFGFMALPPLLAGCSPSEEKQADDLRVFIQTRIIDVQSRGLPRPSDEQRKSFGRFTADYDLIIKFNEQMRSAIGPQMREAMSRGRFTRIEELIERKADISTARDSTRTMAVTLDRTLAEAQAGRAALRQPAPLKAVYDAAFEKIVSKPAEAIKDVLPIMEAGMAQALEMSDFLTANRAGFTFPGGSAQTSSPRLLAEFNRRAQAMQESHGKLQEGMRRMQQAAGM